ncbi:MAG TPA: hypothetical protein V6C58_24655 [Allocoleopsis sp.]
MSQQDELRELFVTEFKNQFDVWQPLHATNSKEKAYLDAGKSGKVIHVIDYHSYEALKVENEKLKSQLATLKEASEGLVDSINTWLKRPSLSADPITKYQIEGVLEQYKQKVVQSE